MQLGNPRWGMDNWVYLNYGPGEISRGAGFQPASQANPARQVGNLPHVKMPRLDFRFHPLTMQFGPDSGLGQYGNTIDRWGHRFFSWNRNPIMMSMLPYQAVKRNPFLIIPKAYTDVAPSGGDAIVYPLVEMKSNWLDHAGTHTSACGVTACLSDLFGGDYADSVFACEPVGHLVTRSIIKRNGVGLTAVRARPKADFLASTDTWFRPASLTSGPDGALYLADMYRLFVEAPRFFPEETVKKLNWRAGDDHGRIWRIVPDGAAPRRFTPPETTDDLVTQLSDRNGWRRFLAQRLLVESQDKDAGPRLRELLIESESALTRLHALWTLDGLDALAVEHIVPCLDDTHTFVRRDAVKLAAQRLDEHPELVDRLVSMSNDDDVLIRYHVVLVLGETDEPQVTRMLTRLAVRDGADQWFALAILTSAKERSAAILSGLVNERHSQRLLQSTHINPHFPFDSGRFGMKFAPSP